jgi:hypothetical protein
VIEGHIIQIMPAVGWHVVYVDEDPDSTTGHKLHDNPLVGWALVEEPPDYSGVAPRYVFGIGGLLR